MRNPNNNEIPILREILCSTFGSEGQSAFFDMLYAKERSLVACTDNKIAAMGYLIPMGTLGKMNCAMIYAVATLPEYRGKGLGAEITNSLISLAYDINFDCVVLSPSDDSLFEYYSKHTQMQEWFYVNEFCEHENRPHVKNEHENRPHVHFISPSEYMTIRELLLTNSQYIKQNQACMEFQKALCDEMGGGLLKISKSCAVVEIQRDGEVWVKELLVSDSDDEEMIKQSIIKHFPAKSYLIRTPVKQGQKSKRFGMIACKNKADITQYNSNNAPWYGMAFD